MADVPVRVSSAQITKAILNAFAESGNVGFLVSDPAAGPPRQFLVSGGDRGVHIWVYAWNLTHGGRPSLKYEYRIQMTGVSSPLPENPDGPTVLIGYNASLKMFAGFDLERHRTFTEGSPSVQVDIRTVHQALQDGIAFKRKANSEVAVGIRPDHLFFYCLHASELHSAGEDADVLSLLDKASRRQDIDDTEFTSIPPERKRVVQEVSRVVRSSNFRSQVLQAYDYRCAVTRMQLRLVEAAHILPVSFRESVDDVRNGIALSPTYHRAFDLGLIYLDRNLVMQINKKNATWLKSMKQDGGLKDFKATLGTIHLPPDRRQWPDLRFIELANQARGIA